MESPVENKNCSTKCQSFCPWLFCKNKVEDDEQTPILRDDPGYGGVATPDEPKIAPSQKSDEEVENTIKVEEIELKVLHIKKVDDILKKFEETFDLFSSSQKEMMTAVKEFKTTMKATGKFKECLKEFKSQLNGEVVTMKKLVLKIPKPVVKSGGALADAATALMKILEVYSDLKILPVKVTDKSFICLKEILELDPSEIVSEEFSGSVFDLGKVPKQMMDMKDNLKEIKKAPGIVKSFFQYSTTIVMQIIEVFGNEKSEEEVKKIDDKVGKDVGTRKQQIDDLDNPKPPKEVSFKAVKVPSIDRIFNDIAKIINPVAKLGSDLYKTRGNLEEAMKTISKFREDKTKAFNDYLDELKQRVKKGDVHIVVAVVGNSIEIKKVEGFEPDVAKNIESGLNGVIKCCDEFQNLGPESFRELVELIEDVAKVDKAEIKSHVSLKEIVATVAALNENSRKAKEIPGILKFFLGFVRNLLLDILDVVYS